MTKTLRKLVNLLNMVYPRIYGSIILYLSLSFGSSYFSTKFSLSMADFVNDPSWLSCMTFIGVSLASIATAIIVRLVKKTTIYQNTYIHLVDRFTKKIINTKYQFFVEYDKSVINHLNEQNNTLPELLVCYVDMISSAAQILIVLVLVIKFDIVVAISITICYLVAIPFMRKVFSEIDGYSQKYTRVIKKRRLKLLDMLISGFSEVRISNMQESFEGEFQKLQDDSIIAYNGKNRLFAISDFLIESVSTLTVVVAVVICIPKVIAGTMLPTDMIAITAVIERLMYPVVDIVDNCGVIGEKALHIDDYIKALNFDSESDDSQAIELTAFESSIKIENLSFSYNDSDSVLKDINIDIKKGQKIGICGSSGCGKSTLLKLLPRFYDHYDGSIKFDGIDTKQLTLKSLRSKIATVAQDPFIFDGTIYDNIVFGSKVTTEDEVIEACKKAAIYDFIMSLPDKFDTNVGPNGLKLSGGQKQRITLARVFLSNADIILLDEATSALDNESERIVQESMDKLSDKTMIIIAHRLTTIKNCDKIVVFDNHTVAESGTHGELLEANGIYASLWNK